jgi:hypothetical protein
MRGMDKHSHSLNFGLQTASPMYTLSKPEPEVTLSKALRNMTPLKVAQRVSLALRIC